MRMDACAHARDGPSHGARDERRSRICQQHRHRPHPRTAACEPWRKQRKLASPPLQPKRIASYAATMRECAQRAFGALRDGQELDLHALLGEVTLEIVGKTLLGVDATGEAERIARVIELFMQFFERQAYSPEGLLPLFIPTPRRVRMRRAVADLDRIIYPMIARCRANGAKED